MMVDGCQKDAIGTLQGMDIASMEKRSPGSQCAGLEERNEAALGEPTAESLQCHLDRGRMVGKVVDYRDVAAGSQDFQSPLDSLEPRQGSRT